MPVIRTNSKPTVELTYDNKCVGLKRRKPSFNTKFLGPVLKLYSVIVFNVSYLGDALTVAELTTLSVK